ncbi:hypothetical protein EDD17DRAFT_1515577 [Pisolithus thermaeus]|nr:hypothetical protein EDD17DRAFT_1515577 [Pisolithus thermaeus]
MFVKNSLALQDAVDRILTIFEMLIVNSGGLEEAEKLEQWRNAVRGIRQELESVRSIANRTDNVPHLLIGMDKYIHWTENLGMPGIPFPDWHNTLFPPLESIASHPWLLTVEQRYDAGLLGSIGHIPTQSTPLGKGKGVDPSEQKGAKVAMAEVVPIPLEDNNRDMSEVIKEDIEMDDIEPASTLENATFSIMNSTKGQKEHCQRGGRSFAFAVQPAREITPAEEEDSPSPLPNKKPWLSKGGQAEASLSSVQPRQINDIIHHQDQMMGRIDEGERQMAEDNSTQTPHADTDTTGTTSNIIEPQDENVGSPSSKSASREVTPTHGEPPAIDQGVELLATESSDNGGQADQGEAANIVEATAVAGEAQPVVAAEGGIGGEHHQMTEENSGECPTEGDGATTILASEQQVGEVSAIISEEELGSTGGKLAED